MKTQKTALGQMIRNFKKIVAKTVGDDGGCRHRCCPLIQSKDPTAVYLCGNTSQEGESKWWIPPKKYRLAQKFIRQLPERARWAEEMAFISDIFEHAARAHKHLSEVCANVSALAKVMDKATLLTVINGAIQATGPAKHTRGISQPGGRQDRPRRQRKRGKREGAERQSYPSPMHPLPGP